MDTDAYLRRIGVEPDVGPPSAASTATRHGSRTTISTVA